MVLQGGTKMSKSAGEHDPQHLMDQFGADAVRMAMTPPDQSFEWSEHGVESANRWIRTRLWNSCISHLGAGSVLEIDASTLTSHQKNCAD